MLIGGTTSTEKSTLPKHAYLDACLLACVLIWSMLMPIVGTTSTAECPAKAQNHAWAHRAASLAQTRRSSKGSTCTHMHPQTHIHKYTHTSMHARMHARTHTHTHTHTYATHMQLVRVRKSASHAGSYSAAFTACFISS